MHSIPEMSGGLNESETHVLTEQTNIPELYKLNVPVVLQYLKQGSQM